MKAFFWKLKMILSAAKYCTRKKTPQIRLQISPFISFVLLAVAAHEEWVIRVEALLYFGHKEVLSANQNLGDGSLRGV